MLRSRHTRMHLYCHREEIILAKKLQLKLLIPVSSQHHRQHTATWISLERKDNKLGGKMLRLQKVSSKLSVYICTYVHLQVYTENKWTFVYMTVIVWKVCDLSDALLALVRQLVVKTSIVQVLILMYGFRRHIRLVGKQMKFQIQNFKFYEILYVKHSSFYSVKSSFRKSSLRAKHKQFKSLNMKYWTIFV